MDNKEKQALFDELLEEGMSAADALDYIAAQAVEEDDVEELSNLTSQLKYHGYSADEVSRLVNYKFDNKEEISAVRDVIKIGRMLPLSEIPDWDDLSKYQRSERLYNLGFDTKNYKYTIDVGCFRYGTRSKVICGEYIYGNERTDRGWTNLVVEGCNVASLESRFFGCMDVLDTLRGNKKQ